MQQLKSQGLRFYLHLHHLFLIHHVSSNDLSVQNRKTIGIRHLVILLYFQSQGQFQQLIDCLMFESLAYLMVDHPSNSKGWQFQSHPIELGFEHWLSSLMKTSACLRFLHDAAILGVVLQ